MEVKKSASSVLIGFQETTKKEESEKQSNKSSAAGITSARDSFEVVKNNGGLFSENRSVQQSKDNSGKKELSPAEQQEVSKQNYRDFDATGKSSSSTQDPASRLKDAKNSGLVDLLGHAQQDDQNAERLNNPLVGNLNSQTQSPEQSSDAVKDAQGKLAGGRYSREALEQEVAQRRQDFTMLGGGSTMDRLYSSPDPTAAPEGKGEIPTGKDAVAYDKYSERSNKDGTTTHITDNAGTKEGGITFVQHNESTTKKDGTRLIDEKETLFYPDNTKQETRTKSQTDINGVVVKSTSTITTTFENGESVINTSTTTKNKDGSITTNTTETKKPAVGESDTDQKSYGYDGSPGANYGYMPLPPGVDDDRSGNMPEYIQDQINQTKPKRGGETELTDGGVTGNSADGSGPVNNAFTRTGGVMGAVGQPTRAGEYVGNPSNVTVGSAIHNGGATDPIDGNNWTGTTHQDDPADVQFGPADQPKEQAGGKSKDSDDSSNSVVDLLRRKKTK